jgi:hypothetical protein
MGLSAEPQYRTRAPKTTIVDLNLTLTLCVKHRAESNSKSQSYVMFSRKDLTLSWFYLDSIHLPFIFAMLNNKNVTG